MLESGWRFEHPYVALAGLVCLLLLLLLRWGKLEAVAGGNMARPGRLPLRVFAALPLLLNGLALILGLVAWANPQHGVELIEEEQYGIAIVNVLDTSESMLALDFGVRQNSLSRIEGAIKVLEQFTRDRSGDLQGLMVFGDKVFTLVPLTADHELVLSSLEQIRAGMAGQATALGDAIALGVKRLEDAPLDTKIMILASDGKNTAGEIQPLEAAQYAREAGVRIYTIGIGRSGPAPFRVETLFGDRVQQISVEMDAATLKEIANRTGGRYFNAEKINELERVYSEIDKLEKSTFKRKVSIDFSDHYFPFLAAALLAACAALLMQVLVLRRFPAV